MGRYRERTFRRLRDIRDYEIQRKDFTVTGTLDRRNGRWVWSPVLRLREGDVVVVRPRAS